MHPLRTYLLTAGETLSAFGRRSRVSKGTLSKIIAGKQWPRRTTAERIAAATGGVVTMGLHDVPSPPDAPSEGGAA